MKYQDVDVLVLKYQNFSESSHVNSTPYLKALSSKFFLGIDISLLGTLPSWLLGPKINSLLFIHLFNSYLLGIYPLIHAVIDTKDGCHGKKKKK